MPDFSKCSLVFIVMDYVRDPKEIYRLSFATVEQECELDQLPKAMHPVAKRLVHSCGMIDILDDLAFSPGAAEAGMKALGNGNAIYTDVEMVRSGITRSFLPAKNEMICTLNDERVRSHAEKICNTRSAAAVDFWGDQLDGSVVVIGNAPTALFRLLELVEEGAPKPELVVGIPVGFIGAVESKPALADNCLGLEYITVHGRRGGSAMAASVVNALASECRK